jgi:hypothetical protein
VQLREGKPEAAETSPAKAVALNPGLWGAHMFFWIAKCQMHQVNAASAGLREEMRLHPQNERGIRKSQERAYREVFSRNFLKSALEPSTDGEHISMRRGTQASVPAPKIHCPFARRLKAVQFAGHGAVIQPVNVHIGPYGSLTIIISHDPAKMLAKPHHETGF